MKIRLRCRNLDCKDREFDYESKDVLASLALDSPSVKKLHKDVFYVKCPKCGSIPCDEIG